MSSIAEVYGLRKAIPTKLKLAVKAVLPKIQSNDLIGIEVEVENCNYEREQLNPVWSMKEDGSLRNGGVEFVTKPISAEDAPLVLHNLLEDSLAKSSCFSPRTSVHIHLNCQDVEMFDVQNIILLYSMFEKLFYRYAGRGRAKNIYCVPLTETIHLDAFLANSNVESWSKYTGLNAKPIDSFGTLEFRHMHGTFKVHKLCTWIALITSLKTYAVQNRTKLRDILSGIDHTADISKMLVDIFGDNAPMLRYQGYHDVANEIDRMKLGFTDTRTAQNMSMKFTSESAYYRRLTGKAV